MPRYPLSGTKFMNTPPPATTPKADSVNPSCLYVDYHRDCPKSSLVDDLPTTAYNSFTGRQHVLKLTTHFHKPLHSKYGAEPLD